MMIKRKKGIAPIVSWVLLIGFAISLAIMIFNFISKQADDQFGRTIDALDREAKCEAVYISVSPSAGCGSFSITNRGGFNLSRLTIRHYSEDKPVNTTIKNILLPPSQKQDILLDDTSTKIEVIPMILVDSEIVGCSSKKVIVDEC